MAETSGTGSVGAGKGTAHSHLSLQGVSMAAERNLVAASALGTCWSLRRLLLPLSDLQTCSEMTAFG